MILTYRNLFFKAIDNDLENDEIRKLDFLASALDIRDLVQQNIFVFSKGPYNPPVFYNNPQTKIRKEKGRLKWKALLKSLRQR